MDPSDAAYDRAHEGRLECEVLALKRYLAAAVLSSPDKRLPVSDMALACIDRPMLICSTDPAARVTWLTVQEEK